MLLFLKYNRAYLDQKNSVQKREFRSYLRTLIEWRSDVTLLTSTKDSKKMVVKLSTKSQINEKLFTRLLVITIIKWLIHELVIFTTVIIVVYLRTNPKFYNIL